jgi:hypothetical protein
MNIMMFMETTKKQRYDHWYDEDVDVDEFADSIPVGLEPKEAAEFLATRLFMVGNVVIF